MKKSYVKLIGLKFDALEGLSVKYDSNQKNHKDAGMYAQEHSDGDTIFIGIPCTYEVK